MRKFMTETPECKRILISSDEELGENISPLLIDGYDVIVSQQRLDILICPVQKER